jgi:alkylation response protein AidB-like acyl-CoA dehydrogenase
MRFGPSSEQTAFAETVDRLLAKADTAGTVRRWAQGDRDTGLELWTQLAAQGVTALLVPEEFGGLAASRLDLVMAFEQLGYHAVPGPWIETVAVTPGLLAAAGGDFASETLAAIAEGGRLVSLSIPPVVPYGLDADAAQTILLLGGHTLHHAVLERSRQSVDPARHLGEVQATTTIATLDPTAVSAAIDHGALACAAQLLGAAQRLLNDTVSYAKSRKQFGRAIGEFQAVKHLLANVRIAIDFARPLVQGAAVSIDSGSSTVPRDVSAAKVSANEAADLAARTALQVHGAIGYTAEFDLSLWLLRSRALTSAWGTSSWHRARILASLSSVGGLGSLGGLVGGEQE